MEPRELHYERLRDLVERKDPTIALAVDEVDVALLRWGLSLSPWKRLQASSGALRFLSTFRHAAAEPR